MSWRVLGRAASAAFFFALSVAGIGSVRADEPAAIVGVNVVNPQWDARAEQDATLDAVQRAGVRVIRIPLVPPNGGTYDGTIDYVDRAARRGLRVLLVVYPSYRPDAPSRPLVPGEPEMFSLPPLSAADAGLFAKTYEPVLRRVDRLGLRLAAIEFGNEINWTAFNGEFAIPGRGIVLGYEELSADPLGRRIATGYRAYLESLVALKRIRDALTLNHDTPILAAGFADFGPARMRPRGKFDSVNVQASLRYMRERGLDGLADGYSIHTYPQPGDPPATRAAKLRDDVLSACGVQPGGTGKPCWLTEWGVEDPNHACPVNDAGRTAVIDEFRSAIAPAVRDGRVRALIFYAWDGDNDPHALVRCGALTKAGRSALAP